MPIQTQQMKSLSFPVFEHSVCHTSYNYNRCWSCMSLLEQLGQSFRACDQGRMAETCNAEE